MTNLHNALKLYVDNETFRRAVARLELLLAFEHLDADAIRGAAELAIQRHETSAFREPRSWPAA